MSTRNRRARPAPGARAVHKARLTRHERLTIVTGALRGLLTGIANAIMHWVLEHWIW